MTVERQTKRRVDFDTGLSGFSNQDPPVQKPKEEISQAEIECFACEVLWTIVCLLCWGNKQGFFSAKRVER
ncbi:hypothetical protein CEXT_463591 [Caerostris extrusa]|uniref:Uncharacterized protein n=1 Tax=Caerostris extrusa TaxID=172846 RepID=A0AAV4UPI5_CAEEX|nr:hypothetical protein CEXT_463591 [Caerostris extrusa]